MQSYDSGMMQLLKNARTILVTSHVHPDGDAVGSVVGFSRSLRKHGIKTDIALATPVGEKFEFMVANEIILAPEQAVGKYDAVVILDIGSEDRTGFSEHIRRLNAPIVNIDHHATNENFGDFNLLVKEASSTCQIVFYFLAENGFAVDAEVAEALFLGLVTDSRYFQNANVNAQTFTAAAALVGTGIDSNAIIRRVAQSRTATDLKVLGFGLSRFQLLADGKIVYAVIRREEFETLQATHRHAWSSGLFGMLITLGSAIVCACFVEAEDKTVFCEFRSKEGFDVSQAAVRFGGGGHKSASGCSQKTDLDSFVQNVLSSLLEDVGNFLSAA